MQIGFHASHEQFPPSQLLDLISDAEQNGFNAVLSSDHFHPWSDQQGESGFAWTWLGAAMQKTSLDFGIVNSPIQRYHPAIIAQAAATLDEMFPARFFLALGSGQALNEKITGANWPEKDIRNKRLKESVEIIRELWNGDYVTHHGEMIVENAKLFTKPKTSIPLLGAAISTKTANLISLWTDGMITISKPVDQLKETIDAYKQNNPTGLIAVKVQISYDPSYEKALESTWQQWKNNIFSSSVLTNLSTAAQFDEIGKIVKKEDMIDHVIIGNKPQIFLDLIQEYKSLGVAKIFFHNVNVNQQQFIQFFGKEIISNI